MTLLFDAPFLSVAGETFPGDPNGSVFDGRLIAVWGAKHPLTCAAQLNCVSSRHGKQADSDVLRRSAGSQPMGLPIGYGFTHDFALCRSAGAVRQFHRLRHAFSVQMVWYLSSTYGQAHRLSSGTPSARFSHDSDDSDDSDKG